MVQACQDFPEIRAEEGLPSCEEEVQKSLLLSLPAQLQPLGSRAQGADCLLLLPAHAHIAHAAVHVAKGRQLKGSAQRYPLSGRFGVQIFGNGRLYWNGDHGVPLLSSNHRMVAHPPG